MSGIQKIIEQMRREPANVPFNDLKKVCVEHFGKARQSGTSHAVFKMAWPGDPRVNIQEDKGKGKAYQVRQVLQAIDKLAEVEKNRLEAVNKIEGQQKPADGEKAKKKRKR
ncbi:MAG: toxin HicA [Noviherbaspirillum sp.]